MALVSCFRLSWCRCWFYSRDHLEPHFHAKRAGEWEVRVFFLEEPPRHEVKLVVGRVPVARLQDLLDLARAHRADLFREWSEKVKVE